MSVIFETKTETRGHTRDGSYHTNAERGICLFRQKWIPNPKIEVKCLVFICHGLNEHSTRYENLALKLNDEGIAVFTMDHVSHGRSDGKKGVFYEYMDFVNDFIDYTKSVKENTIYKSIPYFLLGHSMGGAIACKIVAKMPATYWNGLILSAPAIDIPSNTWKKPLRYLDDNNLIPAIIKDTLTSLPWIYQVKFIDSLIGTAFAGVQKVAALVVGYLLPNLPVNAIDPNGLSRDPEEVKKYLEDPLVHRGMVLAGPASAILKLSRDASSKETRANIKCPVTMYHGDKDDICCPVAAVNFLTSLDMFDKSYKICPGFLHELFDDPEGDLVIKDMIHWVNGHL